MTSRYSSLKQQAQIYQSITGKKCSIFHNTQPSQSIHIKLPSAVKNCVISEGENPFKRDVYHKQNWNCRQKYGKSHIQGHDLYDIILKQGIKMTLAQDSPSFASKVINQRNKTSQVRKKLSLNPQKEPMSKFQSLHNENSSNKLGISNRKIKKQQFKTASTPSFANHEVSLAKLEMNTNKRTINFLLANKSNVTQSNKKSRTKTVQQQSMIRGLMGRNKKLRLKLQKKNQEQIRLQQQIKQYHEKTKKTIDNMKTKYHLNFSKMKKHLKKIQNQQNIQPIQLYQDNIMFNQAIQCDKISEQICRLNFYLKENQTRLKDYEDAINSNIFYQYIEQNDNSHISIPIQQEPQQNDETQSYHRKISIIDNLRTSLINLRLKNEQQQRKKQRTPFKVNQRLKQLLLQ